MSIIKSVLKDTEQKGGEIMNRNLLKIEMLKHGVSNQELCGKIGISGSAFYRKLNGESDFTRSEIEEIAKILAMDHDTIFSIFFGEEVS